MLREHLPFQYAHWFQSPKHLHTSWTPWSVFQDGRVDPTIDQHQQRLQPRAEARHTLRRMRLQVARQLRPDRSPHACSSSRLASTKPRAVQERTPSDDTEGAGRRTTRAGSRTCLRSQRLLRAPGRRQRHLPLTWPRCQVLVTLFAKYFSSFVRTTCALSVSGRYLALAEIYLPFRAAVPISTTRQEAGSPTLVEDGTGVSPSLPGFPENFVHARL